MRRFSALNKVDVFGEQQPNFHQWLFAVHTNRNIHQRASGGPTTLVYFFSSACTRRNWPDIKAKSTHFMFLALDDTDLPIHGFLCSAAAAASSSSLKYNKTEGLAFLIRNALCSHSVFKMSLFVLWCRIQNMQTCFLLHFQIIIISTAILLIFYEQFKMQILLIVHLQRMVAGSGTVIDCR